MKYSYPITIVDNFFDNPEAVVKFSQTLEYKFDPNYSYPGVRSPNLPNISYNFSFFLAKKVLSLFYEKTPKEFLLSISFDITQNGIYEEGWVHRDGDFDITFLIYLNKSYELNCGTSLYELKSEYTSFPDNSYLMPLKYEDFKNKQISEQGRKARIKNNSFFTKVLDVNPLYNRMLAFSSNQPHSANLFDTGTKEDRFILIGGISRISSVSPFQRKTT